jgi:hypothetical protein
MSSVHRQLPQVPRSRPWTDSWLRRPVPRIAVIGLCGALGCGNVASDDGSGGRADVDAGGGSTSDGGGTGGAGGGVAGEAGSSWTPQVDFSDPQWRTGLATGWRNSREALCSERRGLMGHALWSDNTAVFALFFSDCNPIVDVRCDGQQGISLYQNAGDGWTSLYTLDEAARNLRLSGFTGGDLIMYNHSCDIMHVSRDGTATCGYDVDTGVDDVATAGASAYALIGQQVLTYQPPTWTELAVLEKHEFSGALWAGDDSVLVTSFGQVLARGDSSGAFAQVEGVPAGDYNDVWAFGSEIWLANRLGQLVRFDGSKWSSIDTGINDEIRGLWGSSDNFLYFYGSEDFGRWNGQSVERFTGATTTDHAIVRAMWGNASDEVFLIVGDNRLGDDCGSGFMVWFDGSEFHLF